MGLVENVTTRAQLLALRDRLGVREDWHEPDEQDVVAVPLVGGRLDNAIMDPLHDFQIAVGRFPDGAPVVSALPRSVTAEHGLLLLHDGVPVATINLACLLAFACGWEGV